MPRVSAADEPLLPAAHRSHGTWSFLGDDHFPRVEKPDFTFHFFSIAHMVSQHRLSKVSKVSKLVYTQELGCVVGVVAC